MWIWILVALRKSRVYNTNSGISNQSLCYMLDTWPNMQTYEATLNQPMFHIMYWMLCSNNRFARCGHLINRRGRVELQFCRGDRGRARWGVGEVVWWWRGIVKELVGAPGNCCDGELAARRTGAVELRSPDLAAPLVAVGGGGETKSSASRWRRQGGIGRRRQQGRIGS
jgi:hypothetical protein